MSGYICPKITISPQGDLIGEGYPICDEILVGEAVTAGDVLYFKSDGKFYKADADGAGMMPGIALAMQTKGIGVACKVLFKGVFRQDAWNWTAGNRLYVSTTAGAMTATQPTTGESQYVAVALSADVIYFNPSLGSIIPHASTHADGGADEIITFLDPRIRTTVASEDITSSNDTERTCNSISYVKKKEMTLTMPLEGGFRTRFSIRTSNVGVAVYGKVYKNGVAVGTERTTSSLTAVEFTQDFSNWALNDLYQIYVKGGTTLSVYTSNQRLSYSFDATRTTTNTANY